MGSGYNCAGVKEGVLCCVVLGEYFHPFAFNLLGTPLIFFKMVLLIGIISITNIKVSPSVVSANPATVVKQAMWVKAPPTNKSLPHKGTKSLTQKDTFKSRHHKPGNLKSRIQPGMALGQNYTLWVHITHNITLIFIPYYTKHNQKVWSCREPKTKNTIQIKTTTTRHYTTMPILLDTTQQWQMRGDFDNVCRCAGAER
jgi:hypothetical protein